MAVPHSQRCERCNGWGQLVINDKTVECPACGGTGKKKD